MIFNYPSSNEIAGRFGSNYSNFLNFLQKIVSIYDKITDELLDYDAGVFYQQRKELSLLYS